MIVNIYIEKDLLAKFILFHSNLRIELTYVKIQK